MDVREWSCFTFRRHKDGHYEQSLICKREEAIKKMIASRPELVGRLVAENEEASQAHDSEVLSHGEHVDGFVIVSGEYNHGIPPALKNLLDHFLEEYFWRPSAIVCYSAGMFGGVRAAVALRTTLAELGMPAIPSECPIPRIAAALDEDGKPQNEHVPRTLNRFLDEFEWYAHALRRQRREGTPY